MSSTVTEMPIALPNRISAIDRSSRKAPQFSNRSDYLFTRRQRTCEPSVKRGLLQRGPSAFPRPDVHAWRFLARRLARRAQSRPQPRLALRLLLQHGGALEEMARTLLFTIPMACAISSSTSGRSAILIIPTRATLGESRPSVRLQLQSGWQEQKRHPRLASEPWRARHQHRNFN